MENQVLLAHTRINSGFVCLLWFSDDYKTITDTDGEIEFYNSDVVNRKTIDPSGMHDKYRANPYLYNRGKVSLVNGRVEITVGKNCTSDSLEKVKRYLGLDNFASEVVRTGMYDK